MAKLEEKVEVLEEAIKTPEEETGIKKYKESLGNQKLL